MKTLLEAVARAIAKANGDDYDAIPAGKSEWVANRGEFAGRYRDANEPYRIDYEDQALAAIDALHAILREPTPEMVAYTLPLTSGTPHDPAAQRIAESALFLLEPKDLPVETHYNGLTAALTLIGDHRAMLDAWHASIRDGT